MLCFDALFAFATLCCVIINLFLKILIQSYMDFRIFIENFYLFLTLYKKNYLLIT